MTITYAAADAAQIAAVKRMSRAGFNATQIAESLDVPETYVYAVRGWQRD